MPQCLQESVCHYGAGLLGSWAEVFLHLAVLLFAPFSSLWDSMQETRPPFLVLQWDLAKAEGLVSFSASKSNIISLLVLS